MPDGKENLRVDPHSMPVYTWLYQRIFGLGGHPLTNETKDEREDVPNLGQASLAHLTTAAASLVKVPQSRKQWYNEYELMDEESLIRSLLSAWAEESTQPDYDTRHSAWVESKDADVMKAGMECFDRLKVDENVLGMARGIAKYGDLFRALVYQTGKGVVGWHTIYPSLVTRIEDSYNRLVGFRVKGHEFRGSRKRETSWPWDIVHFRRWIADNMVKDDPRGIYGTSLLRDVYRAFKDMQLTEDAILLYRLRRAPDRNMILVDVGNIEESEGTNVVNRWVHRFRHAMHMNPVQGAYRHQMNPLNPLEDMFFPMRKDSTTRVEQLQGSGNMEDIGDLQYRRDKFFGAAGTPKAYFGFEGDINAKATLQQQDVRFARKLKSLQYAVATGLRGTLDINFALISPEFSQKAMSSEYVVQMSPISYLDEWERLELVEMRYRILDAMVRLGMDLQLDMKTWAFYLLTSYGKLPEDMVMKLVRNASEGGQVEGEFNIKASDMKHMRSVIDRDIPLQECVARFYAVSGFDPAEESMEKAWNLAQRQRAASSDYLCGLGGDYTVAPKDKLSKELNEDLKDLGKGTRQNSKLTEDLPAPEKDEDDAA